MDKMNEDLNLNYRARKRLNPSNMHSIALESFFVRAKEVNGLQYCKLLLSGN